MNCDSAPLGLTEAEKTWLSPVEELASEDVPYWIIGRRAAGWMQRVVDHFRGRILFVQAGTGEGDAVQLDGVVHFRGPADTRMLARLVYHSHGVITPDGLLEPLVEAVETKSELLFARPLITGTPSSRKIIAEITRCLEQNPASLMTSSQVAVMANVFKQGSRCGWDAAAMERWLMRRHAEHFLQTMPAYPKEQYGGKGIVICAGGPRYFTCAWVCVKMLRLLGCTLQVEFWHLGEEEMTPEMKALVEPLGVTSVDAHEVRKRHPVRTLGGWELKCYAILHSRFREVLLLDADNVPVRNPEFLFDTPQYRDTGAIFWPDCNRLERDRDIWRICGVKYRDEWEFESGQIVVDKERCWRVLNLAMHYNEHSDYYYQHIYGDKETFHLAWRKLGQEYAMPAHSQHSAPGTICQDDFGGDLLFQHRIQKWSIAERNHPTIGFRYDVECRSFLEELHQRWTQRETRVVSASAEVEDSGGSNFAARIPSAGNLVFQHGDQGCGNDARALGEPPEGHFQTVAAGSVVCLATIWPRDPHGRSEAFVLGELLREYCERERDWALRVVVASAHQSALEVAREVMAAYPNIRADFWWLETEHAGTRPEEISFCKEQLPLRLAAEPGWDWLFFYDADVWTRIGQVPEWMGIIGGERGRTFVKIKYTLRDKLESPAHTLGAYFHHRTLLERLEYWKAIFPRHPDGRRRNAPDCALHDFLERTHRCRKVVPEGIETLHFLNQRDAHRFDAGICSRAPGVRDKSGAWAETWNRAPQPPAGPATMNVVTLWHHEPHPAQARLADYLATAEFPRGSVFIWALAPEMEASLDAARQALTQRGHWVEIVRVEPPAEPILDDHAKHRRVTELYNQIVPMLGEPTVLFMEDDVIPLDRDAAPRLAALLAEMPESSAMVAGAYRSRPRPMGACAVAEHYLFWDKLPVGPSTRKMRVRWAGAGLTLFRTSALRAVMPFRFQIDAKKRKGWDIFVAEGLRKSGRAMWLAPGIRAEHHCPEVLSYCAAQGCAVA